MARTTWENCVGKIIISMNEIDMMLFTFMLVNLEVKYTKSFEKLTLEKRLDLAQIIILEKIGTNPEVLQLIELFKEAKRQIEFRNLIAHGVFRINGDIPFNGEVNNQIEMFALRHLKTISEIELIQTAGTIKKLSDNLSKQMTILEFKLRLQNHKQN